ncbi:MAG TPA: hypothetical protein VG367_08645 [Mucilaginibacter sp.]|jgi:hypothetical protein|nr:hypothetical protein [Mucilaginibacter sp.]
MKKIALTCLACFCFAFSFAQPRSNPDSLAYELQRKKINQMLDQRHIKFGQYDESLKKHTGIFGLQTKKDLRRSDAILMDIARTDDSIFIQTKILLGYRTFQQQQAQAKSSQVEDYSLGYMNTINRLRAQIDRMKADQQAAQRAHEHSQRIYIIALVLMLGSILILLFRK